jgi:site-specific recombinase XerD
MLYKRGRFYWLDIRINGNRFRRSLQTSNKLETLEIKKSQQRKGKHVCDVPNRAQQDLFRRTVIQVKKKTRIKYFHFHLLQHFFTTSLVEQGVDFITISEILGDSKLTTSFIYSHTNKERKKRAVELLS